VKVGDLIKLDPGKYPLFANKIAIIRAEWKHNESYRKAGRTRYTKFFILIDGEAHPYTVSFRNIELINKA